LSQILYQYRKVAGEEVVEHLKQLAAPLNGLKLVHINSTKVGGGVAEILHKMVPLMQELGIDASWEIIQGEADFYQCTKGFHNALQGNQLNIPDNLLRIFEKTNSENAEKLRDKLRETDVVVVHDPQPLPLLQNIPKRRGKWVWRCHIDMSRPYRSVWKYLKNYVSQYDASIFSLSSFAQPMPHPVYLIAPSIDPLHDKNVELSQKEINAVYSEFGIDPKCPVILQVSRYDRFKDPLGVIQAYQLAKKFIPNLQLVLAGGGASDDPEGEAVLNEVQMASQDDQDIKILLLPPDAHKTINALQRTASIVMQKSLREGFGLTVSEAMWKNKPVIGGNSGGIRIQVVNYHTGFLVNSPEGAALKIRYLLHNLDKLIEMGKKAHDFVRENFLITRHLREYLTLIYSLKYGQGDRIQLG
jgi:trehalose synthase